jgi:hypothetical protein
MKTIETSVIIWAKTVVFNACLVTIWSLLTQQGEPFTIIFVFVFYGLLITAPLLFIINPLVKLATRLPYSLSVRITWLFFLLAVLIVLFYVVAWELIPGEGNMLNDIALANFGNICALAIAILTTRKSLTKINTPQSELKK